MSLLRRRTSVVLGRVPIPPPLGAISAVLPTSFAVTADLKAQGKLDAALAVAFGVVADLKAQGKLDAALAIVFNVAANLTDASAVGPISAALPTVFNVAADLKAQGKLDAALGAVFSVAATLSAQGKLDAAAAMVFSVVADLKATGQLEAALGAVFSVAADVKATGQLSAALPMVFSVSASLTDVTVAPAADKLADPTVRAREHIRRARPRPRFYARQWNQFAETFDAFLRRQESLVRQTVLEVAELEEIQQTVIEAPAFVEELEELRIQISDTRPLTSTELLDVLEADLAELIRAMREEEDILAIVALIASTDLLH